jgi:hypothetical protein
MPVVSEPAFVRSEVGIVEFLPEREHRGYCLRLRGILALAFARVAPDSAFTAHKRTQFQRQYATLPVKATTRHHP